MLQRSQPISNELNGQYLQLYEIEIVEHNIFFTFCCNMLSNDFLLKIKFDDLYNQNQDISPKHRRRICLNSK